MADRHQPLSLTLISPEDLSGGNDTVFDDAPETDAWLNLEQEEEYVGFPLENSPCLHGRLVVAVRVYRSDRELDYTLDLSHGELGDAPEAIEEEVETSQFLNLEQSLDLSREGIIDLLWARWEGTVRDSAGNIVANPPTYGQPGAAPSGPGALGRPTEPQRSAMSYSNGVLQWPQPLHGTLRVRYLTGYDRWLITLTPRAGMLRVKEEAYESTLSAFYAGRAENLELNISFDCGGSGGGDDDDEGEDEECWWDVIELDPCNDEPTGKTWRELAACPEATDDEED